MPRRALILILIAGGSLVIGAGVLIARDRYFRSELKAAKRELGNQQSKEARDRLSRVAQMPQGDPRRVEQSRVWVVDVGQIDQQLGQLAGKQGRDQAGLEYLDRPDHQG
jgi:hypothetical protein